MQSFQIAVVVGSLRRDSINRKLADSLVKLAPPEFTFRQLEIGDLPHYNQDEDSHQAESVLRLKREIESAQGLLFVTPEYNGSLPGVLKNAIDHGCRPRGKNSWEGKPAGMLGAALSPAGTAVAQQHLRTVLAYLGAPALSQPAYVQITDGFFDDTGAIANAEIKKTLQAWMNLYLAWVKKFAD